jgi:hypothetical protein
MQKSKKFFMETQNKSNSYFYHVFDQLLIDD